MSSRNRKRCTFTRDLPQLDFHKPLQAGPASVVLGGGVPSWPGSDSGGTPPHSMRCHDDKRLLPNSRSSGIAPACWLCRRAPLRPVTSHPTQALHKRQDGLLTRGHCPFKGRVPPGPAGNDSMEGPVPPGPRDAAEGVFHRTLWNASLQGRTAWKPSLHLEERAVPSRVFGRAMLVQGRVPPGPLSHSGRHAAALHALPRPRPAPPNSRSVWGAPACWRCRSARRRPETYGPTPALHIRPEFLRTRPHTPSEVSVPSRPGAGEPEQATSAYRPQSSTRRAPSPAGAEIAGDRQRTETRLRVGRFLQKGAIDLLNNPPHFAGFVAVRVAGTSKENGVFLGLPVAGAEKMKCAPRLAMGAVEVKRAWVGDEAGTGGCRAEDQGAKERGVPRGRVRSEGMGDCSGAPVDGRLGDDEAVACLDLDGPLAGGC